SGNGQYINNFFIIIFFTFLSVSSLPYLINFSYSSSSSPIKISCKLKYVSIQTIDQRICLRKINLFDSGSTSIIHQIILTDAN
ncbi:unnamed protein product, partial [Brassica napus]